MKDIAPVEEGEIEKGMEPWKVKTLAVGGAIGALVGLGAAFLLVQNAEKNDLKQVTITPREGFRLGVLVLGLLRQVATREPG
jgi:hypothetical protein